MKKAVCVILRKGDLILGVSRKDNHNDMSLPGGKVDEEDASVEFAIKRETHEETGLDIFNLKLVSNKIWGGYNQFCFTADYSGNIEYDKEVETAVVEWVSPQTIVDGSFGAYNVEVFKQLNII